MSALDVLGLVFFGLLAISALAIFMSAAAIFSCFAVEMARDIFRRRN